MQNTVIPSNTFGLINTEFFQKNIGYISISVLLLLLFIIFWYAYKTNKIIEIKNYVIKNGKNVSNWFLNKTNQFNTLAGDNENDGDESEYEENENEENEEDETD